MKYIFVLFYVGKILILEFMNEKIDRFDNIYILYIV